jgi:hypothetical protein
MKSFLKFTTKFLACVLVAWMAVCQSSAVTIVWSLPTAAGVWINTNIVSVACTVNSIKIDTGNSGGATNLSYAITDFPGTNAANGWSYLYQTNAGYMTSYQITTNLVKVTTNFAGLGATSFPAGSTLTNYQIFTNALVTGTNFVGATSNQWRRVLAGIVGSNSAVTITGPFNFAYGVGITNNQIGKDITITLDYDPNL